MSDHEKDAVFQLPLVWEEFTEERVTIEVLRERTAATAFRLAFAHLADNSSPTLDREALMKMVVQAADHVQPVARDRLACDLYAIALWNLLPAARAVADADLDATRQYISVLSRRGGPAFRALHHILSMLPAQIEGLIKADEKADSHAKIRALDVKDFLKDVERLLPQLTKLVSPKRSGRRSNFVLNHSARLVAAAVRECGLMLEPHSHSPARPDPYLTGTGKSLFLEVFKLLHPQVSEATLVRALRAKPRASTPTPAKTSAL